MNNNIIKIQEMLLDEMERLKDMPLNSGLCSREIDRSKALSGSAVNYLKAVNTHLKVKEYAKSNKRNIDKVYNELGITNGKTNK